MSIKSRRESIKSKHHLDFIRSLPCLVCGNNVATEAAHIRASCRPIAKPITGMGIKPPDCYTVPLCGRHHREQHEGSEETFYLCSGGDTLLQAIFTALALYAHSGDRERGEEIVSWWLR